MEDLYRLVTFKGSPQPSSDAVSDGMCADDIGCGSGWQFNLYIYTFTWLSIYVYLHIRIRCALGLNWIIAYGVVYYLNVCTCGKLSDSISSVICRLVGHPLK